MNGIARKLWIYDTTYNDIYKGNKDKKNMTRFLAKRGKKWDSSFSDFQYVFKKSDKSSC